MKKIPITLILFVLLFSILIHSAFAQVGKIEGKLPVEVQATVGEFYLSVSGYISPYASIVMTTLEGEFIRATVADEEGNFSISQVLIRKGFSGFCLTAIDFQRIGESTTCFTFQPAYKDIIMKDLFLPPTLGLSRSEIAAGASVLAFGYTMPGAEVFLTLSDGRKLSTRADGRGYYVFKLSDLKAGTYQLFAQAHYKGKKSLTPTKKIQLKALSLWEQFLVWLRELFARIREIFTSVGLGPLWFGFPLLVLIVLLILRLWPERFTFIYESRLAKALSDLRGRFGKRLLHHAWMVGY